MSDDSLAAQVVHGIDRQIMNNTPDSEENVATQTSRQWYTIAPHVDEIYHVTIQSTLAQRKRINAVVWEQWHAAKWATLEEDSLDHECPHITDKIRDWMFVESRRQGSRMIRRQGSRNKVGVLRQGGRGTPADQHRATRMIIRNLVLNARQLNTSTVSALIGTRIPEEIVVNVNHMAMRTPTVPYACCTIAMLVKHAICCATQRQHR